jgi:palmitoyltransferase ZDHHC13/17
MSGIFAGSLFLVALDWVLFVLPGTARAPESASSGSHILLNVIFLVFLVATTYFYGCSMAFEPGYVPKLNGIAEQKAVIDELLASWKYDEYNFCVSCMIRTPLRSKHCKGCQRCVAKHDQ